MTVGDDLTALCDLEARIGALAEQRDTLRRRLLDRALDTYENEGAAPTWRTDLGTVYLTVPKPRAVVVDEDAFTKSALSIAGEGAVEAVVRVKPNVRDAILSAAIPTESGGFVTTDGEMLAGVTVKVNRPSITIRLAQQETA